MEKVRRGARTRFSNVRWLFPRKLIEFYQFVIKLGKVLLDEFLERFSKKFLVGNLLEKVAKPT